MQASVSSMLLWFQTEKAKINKKDIQMTVSIYLENDSLFDSFLYIKDKKGTNSLLYPLSNELLTSFNYEQSALIIQFAPFEKSGIEIIFEDTFDLEKMVSHLTTFCSIPPRNDKFKEQNHEFIRAFTSPDNRIDYQNLSSIQTILSPIVLRDDLKSVWINKTIDLNKHFYYEKVPMRFNFLTWNVGSKDPKDKEPILDDLSKIFSVPFTSADVVCVALEEMDMSVKSVVTGNSATIEKWQELFKEASTRYGGEEFDILKLQSLGGVCCCAMVRHSLQSKIKSAHIETKKLGANGILANKAAIICKLRIGCSSFSVICCHLAAHDQNCEQRNQQWHEVVEDLKEDDYNIFMGDLNYRIGLSYEDCVSKIQEKKLKDLVAYDQLKNTQIKDDIIREFVEPEIKFNPSYKFDPGTDTYDTSPKHRVPSWTDRILVKTSKPKIRIGPENLIIFETDYYARWIKDRSHFDTDWFPEQIIKYMSSKNEFNNYPALAENICYRSLKCQFSDHRPVHASYKFPVPVENEQRRQFLLEIINAKYNDMKKMSTPDLEVPKTAKFEGKSEIKLTLKNKSLVWARWEARSSSLQVKPDKGMIVASSSCDILITCTDPSKSRDVIRILVKAAHPLSPSEYTINISP